MLKRYGVHAIAVIALLAAFLLLAVPRVSHEPYVYDEADYMYAASLGIAANYTGMPALSLFEYLRIGTSPNERRDLSERIRQTNDVDFYRHWHGPFFEFVLIPVAHFSRSEHDVRTWMLLVPAASLMALYFGCLSLLPEKRGFVAAVLSCTLFLSSHAVIASTELAPHHLFVLCSLCSLFLLARAVATGRRTYWFGAVTASALALCTLEIGFVLVVILAAWAYLAKLPWARSAALFLATVLVIWPAAILKLSLLKAYLAMAYLAFARTSPWGGAGFVATWRNRLFDSPVEWSLVVLGLVLYFRGCLEQHRAFHPILLYALLMIAATLRVTTEAPRYALVFMPELDLLAGLALAPYIERMRRPTRVAVFVILIAGICASAQVEGRSHPPAINPRSTAVLSLLRHKHLDGKALLVPESDLPTIHYYFPSAKLRAYYAPAPERDDESDFMPDAILRRGYPIQLELTDPH